MCRKTISFRLASASEFTRACSHARIFVDASMHTHVQSLTCMWHARIGNAFAHIHTIACAFTSGLCMHIGVCMHDTACACSRVWFGFAFGSHVRAGGGRRSSPNDDPHPATVFISLGYMPGRLSFEGAAKGWDLFWNMRCPAATRNPACILQAKHTIEIQSWISRRPGRGRILRLLAPRCGVPP
jgi:hypothetical protein